MREITKIVNRAPNSLVFEENIPLGARIRLLMPFGQTLRSLLFVNPRPDGSIVFGPGKRHDSAVRTAARRTPTYELPPKLAAALGEVRLPPDFHLTFHASGVINSGGGARTYRSPLTKPGPHQLCRINFEHPGYTPPTRARSNDVILDGEFRLTHALQGMLTLIPDGAAVFYADIAEQVAFILNVHRADKRAAYKLQLSIFGTNEPWPTETTLTWVSQDAQTHGFPG
jgi:hypothetical protein